MAQPAKTECGHRKFFSTGITVNTLPEVNITSASEATVSAASPGVMLTANAQDGDGSVGCCPNFRNAQIACRAFDIGGSVHERVSRRHQHRRHAIQSSAQPCFTFNLHQQFLLFLQQVAQINYNRNYV